MDFPYWKNKTADQVLTQFKEIYEKHKAAGTMYEDPEYKFDELSSPGGPIELKYAPVPKEQTNTINPHVIFRNPSSGKIVQALSILSLHTQKIKALFEEPLDISAGVVCVKFQWLCETIPVIVDTRFPANQDYYTFARTGIETIPWPSLVEKAIGKLVGSLYKINDIEPLLLFGFHLHTITGKTLKDAGNAFYAFYKPEKGEKKNENGLVENDCYYVRQDPSQPVTAAEPKYKVNSICKNPYRVKNGNNTEEMLTFEVTRHDLAKMFCRFNLVYPPDDSFPHTIFSIDMENYQHLSSEAFEITCNQTQTCPIIFAMETDTIDAHQLIINPTLTTPKDIQAMVKEGHHKAGGSSCIVKKILNPGEKLYVQLVKFTCRQPKSRFIIHIESQFELAIQHIAYDGGLIAKDYSGRTPMKGLGSLPQWSIMFSEPCKVHVKGEISGQAKSCFCFIGQSGTTKLHKTSQAIVYKESPIATSAEWDWEIEDISRPYAFGFYTIVPDTSFRFTFTLTMDSMFEMHQFPEPEMFADGSGSQSKPKLKNTFENPTVKRSPMPGVPGVFGESQFRIIVPQPQWLFFDFRHGSRQASLAVQKSDRRISHFGRGPHVLFDSPYAFDRFMYFAEAGTYTVCPFMTEMKEGREFDVTIRSEGHINYESLHRNQANELNTEKLNGCCWTLTTPADESVPDNEDDISKIPMTEVTVTVHPPRWCALFFRGPGTDEYMVCAPELDEEMSISFPAGKKIVMTLADEKGEEFEHEGCVTLAMPKECTVEPKDYESLKGDMWILSSIPSYTPNPVKSQKKDMNFANNQPAKARQKKELQSQCCSLV